LTAERAPCIETQARPSKPLVPRATIRESDAERIVLRWDRTAKELTMNFWKVSTFVLSGVLGLGVLYETTKTAQADAQPNMVSALASLQVSKASLQNATADKGGYRVKAIQNVNDAIDNVKKGIEYDNTHKSKDEKK